MVPKGSYIQNHLAVLLANLVWTVLVEARILGSHAAPVGDNTALTRIYNDFQTADELQPTWSGGVPAEPCTWYKVGCDDEHNVVSLNLSHLGLSGHLSDSFKDLDSLTTLLADGNNLSGQIPKSFGNLKNLETLNLARNSLQGPIPASLAQLQNLQTLDLSFNNFSGELPKEFWQRFGKPSFAGNLFLNFGGSSGNESSGVGSGQKKNSMGFPLGIVAGGIVGGLAILVGVSGACLYFRAKRKWNAPANPGPPQGDALLRDKEFGRSSSQGWLGQLRRYPKAELLLATQNFDPKCLVGQGAFGSVYRATMPDGSILAVKRLKEEGLWRREEQFEAELVIISAARHVRLLQVLGFCCQGPERLLVYPFLPNGSVAQHLERTQLDGKEPLPWATRMGIARGTAEGLSYLHRGCTPTIIHRDIKAANVLLDEKFEAVLGDFGLARLMDDHATHVTTAVRGTPGFIAPEYFVTGQSSEKTDAYAFGVFLLELISGLTASSLIHRSEDLDLSLHDWVMQLVANDQLFELVDPALPPSTFPYHEVVRLAQVAVLCTADQPDQRPMLAQCIKLAEGDGLEAGWHEHMSLAGREGQSSNPILDAYRDAMHLYSLEISGDPSAANSQDP